MSFSADSHHARIGVLLVDDDRLVLRSLARAIRSLRPTWRVMTAESAAEALRIVEREPVELLITDLDMPEVPGDELCTVLRDSHPSIVRVVHTSDTDAAAAAAAHPDSHLPIIRKPLSGPALEQVLAWAVAELRDRGAKANPTSYLTTRFDDDEEGSRSA